MFGFAGELVAAANEGVGEAIAERAEEKAAEAEQPVPLEPTA